MRTVDALFSQYGKKFVPAGEVIKEFWGYELKPLIRAVAKVETALQKKS